MLLLLPVIITLLNLRVLNKHLVDFVNDVFASSFPIVDSSYSWLNKMAVTFKSMLSNSGSSWHLCLFVSSSVLSLNHLYNIKKENLPVLAPEGR